MELQNKNKSFSVRKEYNGEYTITILDDGEWTACSLSFISAEELDEVISMLKDIRKE